MTRLKFRIDRARGSVQMEVEFSPLAMAGIERLRDEIIAFLDRTEACLELDADALAVRVGLSPVQLGLALGALYRAGVFTRVIPAPVAPALPAEAT